MPFSPATPPIPPPSPSIITSPPDNPCSSLTIQSSSSSPLTLPNHTDPINTSSTTTPTHQHNPSTPPKSPTNPSPTNILIPQTPFSVPSQSPNTSTLAPQLSHSSTNSPISSIPSLPITKTLSINTLAFPFIQSSSNFFTPLLKISPPTSAPPQTTTPPCNLQLQHIISTPLSRRDYSKKSRNKPSARKNSNTRPSSNQRLLRLRSHQPKPELTNC